jgi:hypothetical protein
MIFTIVTISTVAGVACASVWANLPEGTPVWRATRQVGWMVSMPARWAVFLGILPISLLLWYRDWKQGVGYAPGSWRTFLLVLGPVWFDED